MGIFYAPRPARPLVDVQPWAYTRNRAHPTEKHVDVLKPVIEAFTEPGARRNAQGRPRFSNQPWQKLTKCLSGCLGTISFFPSHNRHSRSR